LLDIVFKLDYRRKIVEFGLKIICLPGVLFRIDYLKEECIFLYYFLNTKGKQKNNN